MAKDKVFYSERYHRRKVQKFFEVNLKDKVIYEDSDTILTNVRKKQIQVLKDRFKYDVKPSKQLKAFNVSELQIEPKKAIKRAKQHKPTHSEQNQITLNLE